MPIITKLIQIESTSWLCPCSHMIYRLVNFMKRYLIIKLIPFIDLSISWKSVNNSILFAEKETIFSLLFKPQNKWPKQQIFKLKLLTTADKKCFSGYYHFVLQLGNGYGSTTLLQSSGGTIAFAIQGIPVPSQPGVCGFLWTYITV